jgi:hypothetical protein
VWLAFFLLGGVTPSPCFPQNIDSVQARLQNLESRGFISKILILGYLSHQ